MRADSPAAAVRAAAIDLDEQGDASSPALDVIGDASFVLIGEASHGTHEFYELRAELTKRLITEKGFSAVAVEADWPDAYRVNRYVRGEGDDADADNALAGFERFPTWMWRNTVVVEFVEWLREYNHGLPDAKRAGFYGLDLYSLFRSMEAVVEYLEEVDPEAASRARYRYGCFEHFGEDSQAYGYAASFDLSRSCEDEAVRQLRELQERGFGEARTGGVDDFFAAQQNARLVKNAERYYRSMFKGRVSSWNLRDSHMMETAENLIEHYRETGRPAKMVVWAHNSHLGDARATEMGRHGELNLGQLFRQRHDGDAALIGFTTHTGSVTAANDWDAPGERKLVRESLTGSYERLFHDTGMKRFFLPLRGSGGSPVPKNLLERAIGVIYRPESERVSHYFTADLTSQFDAVYHLDETRALEPLEKHERWVAGEVPETYPSGV
jgi:erythromycin esterase-like protein